MQNEPQDSTPEQTNLPQQESQQEQPFTDSVDNEMAKEYDFTPQQAKEMSLYL
jgi:hypothetical protein